MILCRVMILWADKEKIRNENVCIVEMSAKKTKNNNKFICKRSEK